MKNPLRKRYVRELRQDFGKYLVIFLFMIMLISLVSGYLVAADSVKRTYYEGYDKYNLEDGHITFTLEPEEDLLEELEEKGDLKLYDLEYAEEDPEGTGATLRIYQNRTEVNLACLYSGEMPEEENEIALDRVFATGKDLEIGDTLTMAGKEFKITGFIALPDYSCLFENNSDMMLSSTTFGVALVSESGYAYLDSPHVYSNYAWIYNEEPADETEENAKSEDLVDDLEDVIKDYDTKIIQAKVDAVYDQAEEYSDELSDAFTDLSKEMEDKMTDAAEKAATDAIATLTDEDKLTLYMQGAEAEDYFAYAAEKMGKTEAGLVAEALGTTEEELTDLEDSIEELEDDMDSESLTSERPVVNLDDDDSTYENEMDLSSLDKVKDVIAKIDSMQLADVTKINEILDRIEALKDFTISEDEIMSVDSYIPRYQNKAITYCMDDMSSDRPGFIIFDYLVTVIIAFIFAVTISNTISKESGVIGTLRASGYRRGELVRHYLFMPTLVTILAAIVGNVLGYTVLVNYMKSIFYSTFSLANYESFFNAEAFLITTVVPVILMVVINLFMLVSKLKLSPIRFLRRELTLKKKRRAMLLNKKLPFLLRFRLRILFQNIPAYITMFIGIWFAGTIAVFGFMFGPLLDDYGQLMVEERICDYQYVLMDMQETETEGAEKYCVTGLDSIVPDDYIVDEISVYGIVKDSSYIHADIPAGEVLVSEGCAEKFGLKKDGTYTLKEQYSDDTYTFTIADIYPYSSLAVFMDRDEFNETFGEDADHFSGYFSNVKIEDIDSDDVATIITEADLTKATDQIQSSMGEFMSLFKYFGTIMLILMMFLLTKQVIEKNLQSIAMTKILGFKNGEIGGLYLVITSFVVLVSLATSIPIIDRILRWMFHSFMYREMSGYIPYVVSNSCYFYECLTGLVCYIVVCFFMMIKIGKINKSEALKTLE